MNLPVSIPRPCYYSFAQIFCICTVPVGSSFLLCPYTYIILSGIHETFGSLLCVFTSVVDPHWFEYGSGSSFYLNADPDQGAKLMRLHADPGPGHPLPSLKVEFFNEKYTLRTVGNRYNTFYVR